MALNVKHTFYPALLIAASLVIVGIVSWHVSRLSGGFEPMKEALSINERQMQQTHIVEKLHTDFMAAITPIADDAFFNVAAGMGDGDEPALSPESRNSMKAQIEILMAVQKVRADDDVLVDVLDAIINNQDIEEIAPLRERFEATLHDFDRHISFLVNLDKEKYMPLRKNFEVMAAYDTGQGNLFDVQKIRLRQQRDDAAIPSREN